MSAPNALGAALAAARVRGVAVVRGEWRADESAIAVPVFGPAGVVAALELAGGTFPPNEAATALVIAARSLGGRLTEDAVALPSGIGPAPLRWPVDPTLPHDDTASSTA